MQNSFIPLPEYKEFHTKVVFYRVPKNASASIYEHLGNSNLVKIHIESLEDEADRKMYGKTHPSHIKPDEFKKLILGDNLKNYFSFSSVRNPWDRAVSMYFSSIEDPETKESIKKHYKIDKDFPFDLFCEFLLERKDDPYFIPSHNQIRWFAGKYPPREILRFENIEHEFAKMVENHNLVTVKPNLPHKNKSKHTHYSNYYNSETKKTIGEIFEEDIDTFKYLFKEEGAVKKTIGSLRF